MSIPANHVLRTLRTLRRKIHLQILIAWLVRLILVLGAFLVIIAGINHWFLERLPWNAELAAWSASAALSTALLIACLKRLSLREAARLIDRLARTNDRFLTALAFSDGSSEKMRALAVSECSSFIANRDFRKLIPVHLPRESAWILAPIVTIIFLQLDSQTNLNKQRLNIASAQAEVDPTVQKLKQLAEETAKRAAETNDEDLKNLAAKLQKDAEELQVNAASQEEAAKAAMRQLSSLEQLVQEMQKAPPNATSEEIKALAEALAKNEVTKEAAAALQAGKLADAAKALEEASKQENPSTEKAASILKQALEELAKKEMSEAVKQLSRDIQKDGGEGQKSGDALQRLAKMLRQSSQAGTGAQDAQQQQLSKQTLQELLSALQNIKYAESQGAEGNKPTPGKGAAGKDAPVTIDSFGQKNEADALRPGDARIALGQPGSEHDEGTTETPFGEKTEAQQEKGKDTAIHGQLGEGESLSTLRTAGAGSGKASRRYKELYEAMAPAAENAVMQEEIPLGSRVFIKRYFDAIRP